MTNQPHGGEPPSAPHSLVLPPARVPYRRQFYPGRVASVYFDRFSANEWDSHSHPDHDQVTGIFGTGSVVVGYLRPDGKWHHETIEAPAYWVLPRGLTHTLRCGDGLNMVKLYLDRTFVEEILGRPPAEFVTVQFALLASRDLVIAQHSKLFNRLCLGKHRELAAYIESIGTVLGTHVLQALYLGHAFRSLRAGLPERQLIALLRWLDEHLGERLTVAAMAKFVNYCEGHFGVLFKRSMGLTPHEYLMRRRLEHAIELLATTNRKELDIAHSCGFSDDTHLTRRIKAVYHCLPKHFRHRGPTGLGPVFPSAHPRPLAEE